MHQVFTLAMHFCYSFIDFPIGLFTYCHSDALHNWQVVQKCTQTTTIWAINSLEQYNQHILFNLFISKISHMIISTIFYLLLAKLPILQKSFHDKSYQAMLVLNSSTKSLRNFSYWYFWQYFFFDSYSKFEWSMTVDWWIFMVELYVMSLHSSPNLQLVSSKE